MVASALVFQFVPQDSDVLELERVPPYYDKLNSWLGQILQRDIDNVDIELCEMEQYGIAIRICPIESAECPPMSDDIENVIDCLDQQIVSEKNCLLLLSFFTGFKYFVLLRKFYWQLFNTRKRL